MAIKQMTTELQCLHPKYLLKGNKKPWVVHPIWPVGKRAQTFWD